MVSAHAPLRSNLLDETINTFPKQVRLRQWIPVLHFVTDHLTFLSFVAPAQINARTHNFKEILVRTSSFLEGSQQASHFIWHQRRWGRGWAGLQDCKVFWRRWERRLGRIWAKKGKAEVHYSLCHFVLFRHSDILLFPSRGDKCFLRVSLNRTKATSGSIQLSIWINQQRSTFGRQFVRHISRHLDTRWSSLSQWVELLKGFGQVETIQTAI